MQHTFDALIVGAGPAGCAAAYDLARAGRRVLLLDKRSFPRHKACACGLTRKTLKALRYSVEPILERQCRDVVLQEAGPAFLRGRRSADKACEVRVRVRQPFCAMAVRERFDDFCLQQTLAAGRNGGHAELRRIDQILALRQLPTHIELTVALPDGTTQTLTAPALIGADGSNGQTRRLSTGVAANSSAAASSAAAADSGVAANTAAPEHGASAAAPGVAAGFSPRISAAPELGALAPDNAVAADDGVAAGFSPRISELPEHGASAPDNGPQATTAHLPPEPAWYARGFALEATIPYNLLPPTLPAGDHPHDLVFDFAPIAGGYGWLFPKADHINIGVGGFVPQKPTPQTAIDEAPNDKVPNNEAGTLYESVTRALLNTYTREKLGLDLAAMPGAHVTGQHLGLGGHAYTPQGRILLTGDAAGLVDPLTGEGIHSAITSGQAAAAAILEALPAVPNSRQPEAHFEPSSSSKPGEAASFQPSPSYKAGEAASSEPSTFSEPGVAASFQPSTSSKPGEAASFQPSTSSKPGVAAGFQPAPSSKPGVAASLQPSPSPIPGVAAGFSPRNSPRANEGALALAQAEATNLAQTYARHLRPLQETLAFSHRAARSFYREPERGFKVMRTPLLRNLVLKTYADGLPTTRLLASLARRVA